MNICELDKVMKELIDVHSVYGAECVINALVRACKNRRYLSVDVLHGLIEAEVSRDLACGGY